MVGYNVQAAAGQPHDLDSAPGLPLKPAARLNPVQLAVDIELQQHGRMIARSAGRQWFNSLKPELTEIELIDKHIDHPHRIVGTDPVFQLLRKERDKDAWVFGASLRIVMSSIMRRRKGLMDCSVMGVLLS